MAQELWATGNTDAQTLATMIADPAEASEELLDRWAMNDKTLPDSYFEPYLARIETTIHSARNRTKHAMNSALIAIGIRNAALQKKALATAQRIGTVDVDHGETGCKTPDAAAYIQKAWQYKQARTKKQ